MVNCKVCQVVVRPRKNCAITVCEACQKFFRRHVSHRFSLECSSGANNCEINLPSRRACLRCRIEKCIDAGMRSKYAASYKEDFYSTSETTALMTYTKGPTSFEKKIETCNLPETCSISLVRDPLLFDGKQIESIMRTAVQAATVLHGFEFLTFFTSPQKPAADLSQMAAQTAQHISEAFQISLSYGSFFFDLQNLDKTELELLIPGFARQIPRLYVALPNCGPKNFLGLDQQKVQRLRDWFPELEKIFKVENDLTLFLGEWNPPFSVCALIFSLLLFNEKAASVPKLAEVRNNLSLALRLTSSQMNGADGNSVQNCLDNAWKSIRKANHCAQTSRKGLISIASRFSAYSSVDSVSVSFT